eukprot:TRINITY_DN2457_c0_g1_i1.p1 TRINITY_DN2457_c0_g1~~TRINITY_DN2457_c0_g1_i1.p1  ORF type:complete len:808 (-),score=163.12 TRINITY_DN2457_c0_g1_i1:2123-4516(-)
MSRPGRKAAKEVFQWAHDLFVKMNNHPVSQQIMASEVCDEHPSCVERCLLFTRAEAFSLSAWETEFKKYFLNDAGRFRGPAKIKDGLLQFRYSKEQLVNWYCFCRPSSEPTKLDTLPAVNTHCVLVCRVPVLHNQAEIETTGAVSYSASVGTASDTSSPYNGSTTDQMFAAMATYTPGPMTPLSPFSITTNASVQTPLSAMSATTAASYVYQHPAAISPVTAVSPQPPVTVPVTFSANTEALTAAAAAAAAAVSTPLRALQLTEASKTFMMAEGEWMEVQLRCVDVPHTLVRYQRHDPQHKPDPSRIALHTLDPADEAMGHWVARALTQGHTHMLLSIYDAMTARECGGACVDFHVFSALDMERRRALAVRQAEDKAQRWQRVETAMQKLGTMFAGLFDPEDASCDSLSAYGHLQHVTLCGRLKTQRRNPDAVFRIIRPPVHGVITHFCADGAFRYVCCDPLVKKDSFEFQAYDRHDASVCHMPALFLIECDFAAEPLKADQIAWPRPPRVTMNPAQCERVRVRVRENSAMCVTRWPSTGVVWSVDAIAGTVLFELPESCDETSIETRAVDISDATLHTESLSWSLQRNNSSTRQGGTAGQQQTTIRHLMRDDESVHSSDMDSPRLLGRPPRHHSRHSSMSTTISVTPVPPPPQQPAPVARDVSYAILQGRHPFQLQQQPDPPRAVSPMTRVARTPSTMSRASTPTMRSATGRVSPMSISSDNERMSEWQPESPRPDVSRSLSEVVRAGSDKVTLAELQAYAGPHLGAFSDAQIHALRTALAATELSDNDQVSDEFD